MLVKFLLQFFKYFGAGFFLMIMYAAIMGKDRLIEYQIGSKLLIEEYCIIVITWMIFDLTKYCNARIRIQRW